jgi:hypothetical protein
VSDLGPLGDPEAQELAKLREDERARQALNDLRAVMDLVEGRRLLWRIIAGYAGAFSPSFTGEAATTFHREGQRSVGLQLMAEAQRASPGHYVHMLQEHTRIEKGATPAPGG